MIEIKNLKKSYIIGENESLVLKWINLSVEKWDFITIMWPSWSWKSTLMNIIWILDTPSSWEYYFDWIDTAKLSWIEQANFRRDKIWFVFQWYNLLPRLQAWKQVALPLSYKWVGFLKRKQIAIKKLKELWLEDKINFTPDMLSWWQQQRVCIARALVCDPLLILADEPTWALDSKNGKELLELFVELNKNWRTIIMITHDRDVAAYSKKIINIKDWLII